MYLIKKTYKEVLIKDSLSFLKKEKINNCYIFIFKGYNKYYYFKNKDSKRKFFKKEDEVNLFLHNEDDMPAVISFDLNEKEWYKEGYLHRENDFPAKINNKKEEWFFMGLLHREGNRPAIIYDIIHNNKKKPIYIYKYGTRIKSEKTKDYKSVKEKLEVGYIIKDNYGTKITLDDKLRYQSFNGNPSFETKKILIWHKKGEVHNQKNPAIVLKYIKNENNNQIWFKNNEIMSEKEIEIEKLSKKISNF